MWGIGKVKGRVNDPPLLLWLLIVESAFPRPSPKGKVFCGTLRTAFPTVHNYLLTGYVNLSFLGVCGRCGASVRLKGGSM